MTGYKYQSDCYPGCYTGSPRSCYGSGYGSRIRHYSSGSCSGGIRYSPVCIPGYGYGYGYGYGGCGYGNQGRSISYQPCNYGYGSTCYLPQSCYPYNYGQGYLGGYGGYRGYGCYGGYGLRPCSTYTGRRCSYSGPCYGYRRNSTCGPCA